MKPKYSVRKSDTREKRISKYFWLTHSSRSIIQASFTADTRGKGDLA